MSCCDDPALPRYSFFRYSFILNMLMLASLTLPYEEPLTRFASLHSFAFKCSRVARVENSFVHLRGFNSEFQQWFISTITYRSTLTAHASATAPRAGHFWGIGTHVSHDAILPGSCKCCITHHSIRPSALIFRARGRSPRLFIVQARTIYVLPLLSCP